MIGAEVTAIYSEGSSMGGSVTNRLRSLVFVCYLFFAEQEEASEAMVFDKEIVCLFRSPSIFFILYLYKHYLESKHVIVARCKLR